MLKCATITLDNGHHVCMTVDTRSGHCTVDFIHKNNGGGNEVFRQVLDDSLLSHVREE